MRNKAILTKRQQEVYDFIKEQLTKNGQAPTLGEIAGALGLRSLRSVTQHIEALERKGLIRRGRYAKRGVRLIEDENPQELISIPVFASAGCGSPSVIAERTFDEYINVSSDFTEGKKDSLYVIRAIGESMIDAGIEDGDLILVEMTQDVGSNDLVVAIINDTAVIKKISFANNAVILNPVSSDPQYQPIILQKDFLIFGKVIRVIKVERSDDLYYVPTNQE